MKNQVSRKPIKAFITVAFKNGYMSVGDQQDIENPMEQEVVVQAELLLSALAILHRSMVRCLNEK